MTTTIAYIAYFWMALISFGMILAFWPKIKVAALIFSDKSVVFLKKYNEPILNFIWFFFIAIIIGQLGMLTPLLEALWNGAPVLAALDKQVAQGNFMIFAISILSSGGLFIVNEYHKKSKAGQEITFPTRKSFLILSASLLMLMAIQCSHLISQKSGNPLSAFQNKVHWIIYGLSLVLAFFLWLVSEWQGSIMRINQEAEEITKRRNESGGSGGGGNGNPFTFD